MFSFTGCDLFSNTPNAYTVSVIDSFTSRYMNNCVRLEHKFCLQAICINDLFSYFLF